MGGASSVPERTLDPAQSCPRGSVVRLVPHRHAIQLRRLVVISLGLGEQAPVERDTPARRTQSKRDGELVARRFEIARQGPRSPARTKIKPGFCGLH